MKRGRTEEGRIFRRRSRHSGAELPTWHLAYTVDGAEVRESARTTDAAAARKLLRTRLQARDAGDLADPARDKLTVAEVLGRVVDYYTVQGHRSLRTVRGHVAVWRDALGDPARALEVRTARVQRLTAEWKASGTSPATINRRLGILRRAYRLAKLRLDPARLDFGDLFLPENSPRGRYLDATAFAAIHAALPTADLQAFFAFAYLCGTRKQQLARTTIAHLNQQTWTLTWQPDEVKAKHPHLLPLDGRPLEIIKACVGRRPLHCRYLFHGPRCAPGVAASTEYGCLGDFKKAWATACRAAGFPVGRRRGGFVFHNTRHSAVTNLVNSGTPKHEAMLVSGHRTGSVFDRYAIGLEAQTRAAMRRSSEYLDAQSTDPTVVPLPDRPVRTG